MTRTTMKSKVRASRTVLALLLAVLAAPLIVRAQAPAASSDLPDRIDAVLLRFPSVSGPDRDAASAALLALGEPGVLEVCRRLAPAGTVDDSHVRYALHGAAVYAARAGAESERAAYAAALLKALDIHPQSEAKAFLISQIQWLAKDDAVPALAAYLSDPVLADPASRALATIGGAGAEKALLAALTKTAGAASIPVIQALGSLRSRPASPELLTLLRSSDPALREAAFATTLSAAAEQLTQLRHGGGASCAELMDHNRGCGVRQLDHGRRHRLIGGWNGLRRHAAILR